MSIAASHLPGAALPAVRSKPSCVLRTDPQAGLRIVHASDALGVLLGRPAAELAGLTFAEAFGLHPDIADALMAADLRFGGAYECDLHIELPRRRLTVRLLLALPPAALAPDALAPEAPAGTPDVPAEFLRSEFLAVITDVLSVRAVGGGQASSPRQSFWNDPANAHRRDLMIVFTPDFVVRRCSESYAALYGRRPADMVGRNLADWLPAEELSRLTQAMLNASSEDIINSSRARKLLPDGSERWYQWIDVAIGAPVGTELPEILAVGIDVTELELAQARLRDAIESINEGFVLFDRERRLVLVNEEFRRMYSRAQPAIRAGITMRDLLRISAASGELGSIDDIDAFADEVIAHIESQPEIRYQRKLADGRWILISQRRTSDGGYVGLRTDITAVKQHEEALLSAGTELATKNRELEILAERLRDARIIAEESNRAKSRFLAHMSHELRTPLNGILGFAEVMTAGLFGPIQPPRYAEYVQLIHNSGKLLLSLINDVLDMSKIEAGKMELKIESLKTEGLGESCRQMMAGLARESSIALEILPTDRCPSLDGDERAVKQMIINLMSNAIKFTPPGGRVSLGFRDLGQDGVEISVTDSGIGMTAEELEKAMQPFGQIDSEMSRQHDGTGIGLPLVKSLAELHGGRLRLLSEKGGGTTALIVLPRHESPGLAGAII
jgi:PAS domain S-box-containing protein